MRNASMIKCRQATETEVFETRNASPLSTRTRLLTSPKERLGHASDKLGDRGTCDRPTGIPRKLDRNLEAHRRARR